MTSAPVQRKRRMPIIKKTGDWSKSNTGTLESRSTGSEDRCYLCGRKGHYSKNCPNKKDKAAKLASNVILQGEANISDAEIESLFSEQEQKDEDTVFAIEDTSSEDEEEIPCIFMAKEVPVQECIPLKQSKLAHNRSALVSLVPYSVWGWYQYGITLVVSRFVLGRKKKVSIEGPCIISIQSVYGSKRSPHLLRTK